MGAAASTASSLPLERWTAEQVASAVASCGGKYEGYGPAIVENGINGDLLVSPGLDLDGMFVEIGVSKLHATRLAADFRKLLAPAEVTADGPGKASAPREGPSSDARDDAVNEEAVARFLGSAAVAGSLWALKGSEEIAVARGRALGVYRMAVAKLIRHGGFDFYRVLYRDLTASVVSPLQDWAWVRHVGAGTYGNVCAVRSLHNDSTVACKLLGCDDDARRMLGVRACTDVSEAQQEMVRLTQVSSPHCVRLRQYATVAEPLILWALTDLCEGGALSERLKRRPPPAAARLERWWRDATAGLAAIHKLRVAHRDVKTENIFLTSVDDGAAAVVGDLGISKELNSTSSLMLTQCGTPAFLAPEILSNQPYTLKADVWSLGCVFFETAAWRQRQLKRRASSSKPKPPAPRPAPAPAAPKPPPSREVGAPASFLKEALDDAEPPRDAAADERKARQRAAEDAKAIAELERGAASVRDFHRAPPTAAAAREPRFQQSQTSPRLP
ncbi:serine/threonine kinase [Aureococcus anophagefferens]|nr:serine/threonine kinase [Aureococcus anophagefferens]